MNHKKGFQSVSFARGGKRYDLMLYRKVVLKLKTLIRKSKFGQMHDIMNRKLSESLTN